MKTDVPSIAKSVQLTSPIVGATLMLLHAHETKDRALIERAQAAFDIIAAEERAKAALLADRPTTETPAAQLVALQRIIDGLGDDLADIDPKPTNPELRVRVVSVTTAVRDLAEIVYSVLA